MSHKKRRTDSSIQSIERAAAILRSFAEANTELGVTDLSRRLDLHKSTVSRFLSTLQREGFVQQNPETSKYRLGLRLVSLASVVLDSMDVRRVARPYLERLADQTQETVNITVLDGDECVNIDRVASPKPIRYVGWIGRRTPPHCTSTGKVLLAYLSSEQHDAILPDPLPALTSQTITDRQELEAVLAAVRENGYATAHEEFEEGLSAIAAPLRNHTGNVIATVSISGPTYRIGTDDLQRYVDPLREVARNISAALGYRPESNRANGCAGEEAKAR